MILWYWGEHINIKYTLDGGREAGRGEEPLREGGVDGQLVDWQLMQSGCVESDNLITNPLSVLLMMTVNLSKQCL